ncbi:MAG TPA: TetR/AcrR family transcriptional regulator [Spongiibacteraceae bacterium]|nr:TetR/AcrR family transcriptional regulator [Spongiibacteraceae bacterium]
MNPKTAPKKNVLAQQQRNTRSRAALCDALLALLTKKLFEEITVKEITTQAGVGYATFFRHYPDKETLLHHLAADEINRLLGMSMPLFYSVDSLASNQALCAYVWEHRKLWAALLTGGAAATLKEEYLRLALQVYEATPTPKSWLPSDLAVTFSVTALLEILAWRLKQTDPPSVKQMAEIMNRLTVIPVLTGASAKK